MVRLGRKSQWPQEAARLQSLSADPVGKGGPPWGREGDPAESPASTGVSGKANARVSYGADGRRPWGAAGICKSCL